MKGISNKILFLCLGLAFAQPMAIRTAEPVAQAGAQMAQAVFGPTLRAQFTQKFWIPFAKAVKMALFKTGALVGAGYVVEDTFVSQNPSIAGQTIRNLVAGSIEQQTLPSPIEPPAISIWDTLENIQQTVQTVEKPNPLKKFLNIANIDGKSLILSNEEKESLLEKVGEEIAINPLGNPEKVITITPSHERAVGGIVRGLTGLPRDLHSPAPTPKEAPTPPVPQTDNGWLSYIPGATMICNNPKTSVGAYVVGGALALYTYKKLKLASYKAKFYQHLTDHTVLGNQAGLDECARMMRDFDPVQYQADIAINSRMATDFINRLTHQNMSSGFLKFIFPAHVALFSALRYAGSIA